jgi:UDP-glucose 4-epimerase
LTTTGNTHARAFAGAEVLITGGLGFIGSNLAHRLVALGARVSLVDNLASTAGGSRFNISGIEDLVRVHEADIADESQMSILVAGVDYIFNLAGLSSHLDSMRDPDSDLDANCRSHLGLLEACRKTNGAARIVFASTRQVYGRADRQPVDETATLRPIDVNGIHKVAAESYHLLYNHVYGIPTCSLRLTNTIGPRMRIKDERQTFLGVWLRHLLEGKTIEVWGGTQLRDFTYVDDAVEAFLLAATSEALTGGAANIGGQGAIPLADLARLLIRVHGTGRFVIRAFPEERRRIDIGDYIADYGKAKALLGWEPRTNLENALERTVRFYRDHSRHYL